MECLVVVVDEKEAQGVHASLLARRKLGIHASLVLSMEFNDG